MHTWCYLKWLVSSISSGYFSHSSHFILLKLGRCFIGCNGKFYVLLYLKLYISNTFKSLRFDWMAGILKTTISKAFLKFLLVQRAIRRVIRGLVNCVVRFKRSSIRICLRTWPIFIYVYMDVIFQVPVKFSNIYRIYICIYYKVMIPHYQIPSIYHWMLHMRLTITYRKFITS